MGGALGLHAARKDGRDELHCTRPDCPRCRTLLAMRGDAVLASSVRRPYDGNPNEYKSGTLPPPPGCAMGAPTEHELERRREQAAKQRRAEAARRGRTAGWPQRSPCTAQGSDGSARGAARKSFA